MAMVARGEVDLYVNTYANFSDWDICAGDILVTEAGGSVSGIAGNPIRYGTPGNSQTEGLLATNGGLRAAAVTALQHARS
jgi:fructose-1,6-bisphosphatase/inositol monophosphatase family enzyme